MVTGLIVTLFVLLLGLVLCFAGYPLFMSMLPAFGFLAGFWLGAEIGTIIFGGGFLQTQAGWIAALIGGIILALLAKFFYVAGVAAVAAAFGFILGTSLMRVLGVSTPDLALGGAIACAVVVMLLAQILNLQKYIIIVITAMGGAYLLVMSGPPLLNQADLPALLNLPLVPGGPWLLVWLILAAAGFIVQAQTYRKHTHPSKAQTPESPPGPS